MEMPHASCPRSLRAIGSLLRQEFDLGISIQEPRSGNDAEPQLQKSFARPHQASLSSRL